MRKSKQKETKKPIKKMPAPRPAVKQKKKQTDDKVEELFGVHIISDEDIENHFGTSESDSGDESKNK